MTSASIAAHRHPAEGRWRPALRGFAAWRRRAALKTKRASAYVVGAQATGRRLLLTAVGLGFLDAAAYGPDIRLGLAVTGASVLIFNECMN